MAIWCEIAVLIAFTTWYSHFPAFGIRNKKSFRRTTDCICEDLCWVTMNSSLKNLLTTNRLRLCSVPAVQNNSSKRIFALHWAGTSIYNPVFGASCRLCLSVFGQYPYYRLKRRSTWENARPRRASCTFVGQMPICRTKVQLAVSLQKQKSAAEIFLWKLWKTFATASGDGSFPVAILQPCGRQNKPSVRTGAVVSRHRNRGLSVGRILHHER